MDVKKMLAVGAAVVGTVAMADIVSSSVVGYKTDATMKQGNTLVSPSFISVGGTSASLNDMTPGNIGEYVNGEINFESLDQYGRSVEGSSYQYLGYEGMTGWYDGEFGEADKTFDPCEAVWMALPGEEGVETSPVTLTDAGQVNTTDVTVTLRAGNTAIGNMMAIDYPIADIEVGNIGEQINGEINFESLDVYGRSVEGSAFQYLGYEGMTGWYDGEFNEATTSLAPGQGIWLATNAAGVTLKFYAPDL